MNLKAYIYATNCITEALLFAYMPYLLILIINKRSVLRSTSLL
jgi:hypothetical protein